MSLRCTSECKVHLGQTISEIAGRHGGNGGGHARAAGCTVPLRDSPGPRASSKHSSGLGRAADLDRPPSCVALRSTSRSTVEER